MFVPARYAREVSSRVLRFETCSIDLAARELHRDGELVTLSPRVFDCIAWLIEHRERAVGRDELSAAVWGKADVADTQVVQAVLKARRAIGDTGEEQRAIRTIPRFGYRWIAPVDCGTDAGSPLQSATTASPVEAARASSDSLHLRRTRMLIGAFALVALACGIGWASFGRHRIEPAGAAMRADGHATAVVLPASVEDREWGWLRLGVMDLVAGRLREAGLSVVPSDNVVSLLREEPDPQAAEQAVRRAVAPRWTVVPQVRRTASGWVVAIELHDGDLQPRMVEASDADPVAAARRAVGGLLPILGKEDASAGEVAPLLVSRVRAALLGNDFVAAQRLLDTASQEQRTTPEIRLLQGQAAFGLGRFEVSRDQFTQLLGMPEEQLAPLLRARALKGRAAGEIRLSELDAAEHDYAAALDLLRDRPDPALEGQIYSGRGVARALRGGNDEAAMADFARARIALQLAGDTLALAGVDMNEGALKGQRGQPAEALASFRAAEGHFARFDSRTELASALANRIEAYLALLDPKRALETSDRAQDLVNRLADPSAERLLMYWRASALAANGRLAEAGDRLDLLIQAADATSDSVMLAMARSRQASLAFAAGAMNDAAKFARAALDGAAGSGAQVRREAWLTLIRALRGAGGPAGAALELERFAAWASTVSDPAVDALVHLAQAEQAWSERRLAAAASAYAAAWAQVEARPEPAGMARVGISWAATLLADGEVEKAVPVAGRLARWASTDYACALLQVKLYRSLGQQAAWQAALAQARALAGERALPVELTDPQRAARVTGR